MQSKKFLRARQLSLLFDFGDGLMAGVDEVGRGPLAGPVVAAAVILDERQRIRGLNDSKLLSAPTRERLHDEIRAKALCCASAWPASTRSMPSTSCRRHCWRCAAPSMACGSCRTSSSSMATSCRACRWRAGRSSVATPRCARSRRPRSSPRSIAIDSATICTPSIRSTASATTRAIPRREHLAALRRHGACRHHRRSFAPVREVIGAASVQPLAWPA